VANIIYGPSVIPPSKFWTLAGDESFFSLTFQALLLHVCAGVAFSDGNDNLANICNRLRLNSACLRIDVNRAIIAGGEFGMRRAHSACVGSGRLVCIIIWQRNIHAFAARSANHVL